jgi:hypothetical protein
MTSVSFIPKGRANGRVLYKPCDNKWIGEKTLKRLAALAAAPSPSRSKQSKDFWMINPKLRTATLGRRLL